MNREEVVPFKLASLEEFGTEDLWLKYLESNKPASRNAFVQFLLDDFEATYNAILQHFCEGQHDADLLNEKSQRLQLLAINLMHQLNAARVVQAKNFLLPHQES